MFFLDPALIIRFEDLRLEHARLVKRLYRLMAEKLYGAPWETLTKAQRDEALSAELAPAKTLVWSGCFQDRCQSLSTPAWRQNLVAISSAAVSSRSSERDKMSARGTMKKATSGLNASCRSPFR